MDKLYVIICLHYFDQLLLGYIVNLLIVNHLTVLPSAQAQSYGSGARHLVYALVYSREYKNDLILMCICHNCALFSSSCLHHLNRSHAACECSTGTRQYYASNMAARWGGHGTIQSIISQTNNGCSLLSETGVNRNFWGAPNFKSAARTKIRKRFERATFDWLKTHKVTSRPGTKPAFTFWGAENSTKIFFPFLYSHCFPNLNGSISVK